MLKEKGYVEPRSNSEIYKMVEKKICKKNTLKLWEICHAEAVYAEGFHGNLMCRNGCSNPNYYIVEKGERIYCGWNLHYILSGAHGGSNTIPNLFCTNIAANETAGDRITFWIENCLHQVQKYNNIEYKIVESK